MLKFDIQFDDKEMLKDIRKQKKRSVTVGFFDEKYPDGKRVGKIATIQEYGAPEKNIPPRPFMRYTEQKNKRKWFEFVRDMLPQNMDLEKTMSFLGDLIAEDVRDSIIDWDTPPNRPSTIARKGFNDPLIDTGRMRDSVGWKVGRW